MCDTTALNEMRFHGTNDVSFLLTTHTPIAENNQSSMSDIVRMNTFFG